ncbi:MAG: disulfide bond formation protein DsbB [archaeon GW2011_AR5]|nr:MAG: disulfide bond formation protein DsbB [archaeon GW2011_AR5]
MMIPVETLNTLLGLGTIALQIGTVVLVLLYFSERANGITSFGNLIRRFGLWLAFLVTLGGTVLSLYYSEIIGFVPCGLCWLQRIFLFPQVLLLGYAAWKKEFFIAPYIILLSIAGGFIALYQHALQMGYVGSILPCPASPGADCAQRLVFEFGYITIPLMAFSAFLFVGVLMWFLRKRQS